MLTPQLLGLDFLDPEHLIQMFGDYALWGVVAIIFAECGLLIGFFFPGDSLLFTVGLFVAHDFNIGSIVRTANAFLAAQVHIVGRRRWNRRGAMVTDRYQHIRHHAGLGDLVAWAHEQGLPLLGVDNLPGADPLETYDLPRECVLLFGQEGPGLSHDARKACDATLSIAQFGSTRSINASAAAAIAMHSWVRQHTT